jgi:hypothetical protein
MSDKSKHFSDLKLQQERFERETAARAAKPPLPMLCSCGALAKFEVAGKLFCADHAEAAEEKFIAVPIVRTR